MKIFNLISAFMLMMCTLNGYSQPFTQLKPISNDLYMNNTHGLMTWPTTVIGGTPVATLQFGLYKLEDDINLSRIIFTLNTNNFPVIPNSPPINHPISSSINFEIAIYNSVGKKIFQSVGKNPASDQPERTYLHSYNLLLADSILLPKGNYYVSLLPFGTYILDGYVVKDWNNLIPHEQVSYLQVLTNNHSYPDTIPIKDLPFGVFSLDTYTEVDQYNLLRMRFAHN